ncbi:MAG TPA: cadherin-like beta sandwich domain-containing protein, partial [Armatimonadota bacterium]|nr:cadherin-like beta sandwich domain-containing protein [Armatimonadota bacterium]
FTGGSIDTHLTGNFAASPTPTDGNGSSVYKTTATLPDIHTPTAVTVTPAGGSSFSAQTDASGGLYIWLPETTADTVLYNVATDDGTDISYELKGTVKTDGTSQLTPYRTDAALENLTFNGQQASLTSTPGTYQVNVGSSTTGITIQKSPTSDLQYTVNNGTPHSGTESVTVPITALETDLNIHIVGQTTKDYVVHIMRAPKNDTALTSLAIGGMPRIPDANGEYRVAVVNSLTSVKVCAVPEDPGASYTVLANGKTLTPGAEGVDVTLGDMGSTTDASVVVRAEDGTTQKTYRVFILRSGSRLNDLISILSPAGASVSGRNITASVDNGTASIPVNITASWGATWELYSDPQCLQAIANHTMALQVGTNTAYLKIISQDGSSLSVYTLTVTRAAASTPTPTPTPSPTPSPSPSPAPKSSSHETPTPSLPSSLTNSATNTMADLSGAILPSGVTGVSLAVTPETASGAPAGTAGGAGDPQGAAAYNFAVLDTALNVIGTPVLYNIKLLDQNGNPISSFTGSVTVKIPIPAGLHGTPHVFRYEESTGALTDLGAAVQNGFLVFSTTHFSYYIVAG